MRIGSSTLAALSLLLVAGCTPRHSYTPPETLEGKACVARCQEILEQCAVDPEEPRGLETDKKCIGEPQEKPVACPPGIECPPARCRHLSDESACGDRYRQCYRDCGGLVDDR
jgi:hypothetical protein